MKRFVPLLMVLAGLLLAAPPQTASAVTPFNCSDRLQSDEVEVVTAADLHEDEKGHLKVDVLSSSSELNFAVNDAANQTDAGPFSARTRARVAGNGIVRSKQQQHRAAHRVANFDFYYAALVPNQNFEVNAIKSATVVKDTQWRDMQSSHARAIAPADLNLAGLRTDRLTTVQLA